MSPTDTETVLKFLVDKLDPNDRADLEGILGNEVDSIAEDVMNGRLKVAADAMPDSLKRQIRAKTMPDPAAADAEFLKQFPHSGRLR